MKVYEREREHMSVFARAHACVFVSVDRKRNKESHLHYTERSDHLAGAHNAEARLKVERRSRGAREKQR